MSVIKSQNDIVSVQLRLYNENRETFIATMGEGTYNQKIIDLLNKLPDPSVVNNPTEEIPSMMPLNCSFNYGWCISYLKM